MNSGKYKKNVFLLFLITFLSVLSSCANTSNSTRVSQTAVSAAPPVACSEASPGGAALSPITVTVKQSCVLGVSNYAAGLTYSNNSLISYAAGGSGNAYAV